MKVQSFVDRTKKIHSQISEDRWYKGGCGDWGNVQGVYRNLCLWSWVHQVYGVVECDGQLSYPDKEMAIIKSTVGMCPQQWNDKPERTFKEVVTLLRKLDL